MGRFNGNNSQSTLEQFIERGNFSFNAYGPGLDAPYPQPIKDFNYAERILYGRINKAHDVIFLKKTNLVQIANQSPEGSILRAANFVAEAFSNFVSSFQTEANRGRLDEKDPYIYNIVPTRAYIDSKVLYEEYILSLRNVFIRNFLTKKRRENIINFDSFLKLFFQYIFETAETLPISKTAFIASHIAGPLVSGLCIEIANLDASDDSVKEKFINSPNFEYYKLIARNNGFSIDKQVPWRLIADIASTPMLRVASRYGAPTENKILNILFSRAGGDDLIQIKRMAVDFYNHLVSLEPSMVVPSSLNYSRSCGVQTITRDSMTLEELVTNYNQIFWIDNYINLRYVEQKKPVSEGALIQLKKESADLLQASSPLLAVYHINNTIKTFDNFQGSYARRVLDRQNFENDENLQPTY